MMAGPAQAGGATAPDPELLARLKAENRLYDVAFVCAATELHIVLTLPCGCRVISVSTLQSLQAATVAERAAFLGHTLGACAGRLMPCIGLGQGLLLAMQLGADRMLRVAFEAAIEQSRAGEVSTA